jgi:uncharacterized protein YkwD
LWLRAEKIGTQTTVKRRRVTPNYELRRELIAKGFIIPPEMVPQWLKSKGFLAAAEAAAERLSNRRAVRR